MGSLFFSPSARHDLDEVLSYIARDKPAAALAFVVRLEDQCRTLAMNPEIGFRRDEINLGLRAWPVGKWVIFYRSSGDETEIVRIVHGARDLPGLF